METNPTTQPGKAPAYTPFIPRDQDEKAALALRLAAAWKANPQLVLIWTTQAAYEAAAKAYSKSIVDKTAAAALRGGITISLKEADAQIKEGLPYLKAALLTKFRKGHDQARYPEFGIIARSGGFELPKKHTERAKSLTMLVKALTEHGLEAGDYGKAFWQPLAAAYVAGDTASKTTAATVGGLVGSKGVLEAEVDLVLSKMLLLLEAQYPNEIELGAKRRELGYLREYNN